MFAAATRNFCVILVYLQFSDGWATVQEAGRIAKDRGYDFVIITDHLRNLPKWKSSMVSRALPAGDSWH